MFSKLWIKGQISHCHWSHGGWSWEKSMPTSIFLVLELCCQAGLAWNPCCCLTASCMSLRIFFFKSQLLHLESCNYLHHSIIGGIQWKIAHKSFHLVTDTWVILNLNITRITEQCWQQHPLSLLPAVLMAIVTPLRGRVDYIKWLEKFICFPEKSTFGLAEILTQGNTWLCLLCTQAACGASELKA